MYNQNIAGGSVTGGTCPYCGRCPHCGMGGNYPLYPNGIGGAWCGTTPQTQCAGTSNCCNPMQSSLGQTVGDNLLSQQPNITT